MAAVAGTDWINELCDILDIPTHGIRRITIEIPYEDVVEVHVTRIVHDTQLTDIYCLLSEFKTKKL